MTQSKLIAADAILSPCRTYRYLLTRRWAPAKPCDEIVFILLNPSTADESVDDPTIRRCITFAKNFDAGGLMVVNLFALRSTNPDALVVHADPVGPENDEWILRTSLLTPMVICGWGVRGELHNRSYKVLRMLLEAGVKPKALELSKHRHPKHPLYLRGDLQPIEFMP